MGKDEEMERKREDLYCSMTEIRRSQKKTVGDQFRYVRGKGLVERN